MPGYTTYQEVARFVKKDIGDHTDPDISDVMIFIENGYAEINSVLYTIGIDVPIIEGDSPESFRLVKELNNLYAAKYVENLAGTLERTEFFKEEYESKITKLQEGDLELTDIVRSGDEIIGGSKVKGSHGGFKDEDYGGGGRRSAYYYDDDYNANYSRRVNRFTRF